MRSTHSLKIGLLTVVLIAAGCATLDSVPLAPDAEWLGQRLAAGQYAQAGAALQSWRSRWPDDAGVAVLQQNFDTASAQFRDAAIADARQLVAEQHWADADQRLLAAMQQMPDDEVLKAEYAQFDQQREQQRKQQQLAFDVEYAQRLPVLLQHARTVFELKPQDLNATAQLRNLQESATAIAARLAFSARRAQEQGGLAVAVRNMRLAAALSDDPALAELATQWEQQMNAAAKSAAKAQHMPRSEFADALSALDAALQANQLEAAQATLKRLQAQYGANAQLQQYAQRFEAQRREFVAEAIEQGKRYYSNGDLAHAIESWERAYLFDPGNKDLQDRIDRARKFRAKVESLQ
jgi:hypothetical protein